MAADLRFWLAYKAAAQGEPVGGTGGLPSKLNTPLRLSGLADGFQDVMCLNACRCC